MRQNNLCRVTAREEFHGDLRFRAFGIQFGARTITLLLGPGPAKDDLFRWFYFEILALSPVRLALARISNLHQITPTGPDVLHMMSDHVRGHIPAHPLL